MEQYKEERGMKTLIVYDSVFGNTKNVAQAMQKALGTGAQVVKVNEVTAAHLQGLDLLIAGSPTRAFKATGAMSGFLRGIQSRALKGVKVAAFDTRMYLPDVNNKFLNFMVGIFGYAAEPMAKKLTKKGGTEAIAPAGFFVKDSEGPMKDGEIERAAAWAAQAAGEGAAS
jgi:flavodoxin